MNAGCKSISRVVIDGRFGWTLVCAAVVALTAFALPARAEVADDEGAGPERMPRAIQELPVGESPYVQERGEIQVTFGVEHVRAGDERETELELQLEYGLTDRLQFGLEVPWAFVSGGEEGRHNGLGDLETGVLYNFLRDEHWVATAGASVSFPTGDESRSLGAGQAEFIPSLQVAHALAEVPALSQVQILGGIAGGFASGAQRLMVDATVAAPLGSFVPLVELSGSFGKTDELYLTPALVWQPSGGVELALGVPVGLTDDSDDWRVVAKLTFEFGGR